jgi:bifunctional NMN adenylyltransferase/nudix hydrolase
MEQAVLRELVEETTIKVPEKILKRIVMTAPKELFSKPDRSLRGRTFTQAYLIQLNDDEKLPFVKGADDANSAKWIPIAKFKQMQSQMFEDHYAIVNKMLNKML